MKVPVNSATRDFINELQERSDVIGIILFGSWARGNNRPDSDVDLMVFLTEGFCRAVEKRGDQYFEIIYTTPDSAYQYWEDHKDDAAELWRVAKIVCDKTGAIAQLRTKAQQLLSGGKPKIGEQQLAQFRFDAEDQVRYAEAIFHEDAATANMILYNKIFTLTELFFDIRQQWTPAPKQRLAEINRQNNELYSLLQQFYGNDSSFAHKVRVAGQVVAHVF